MVFVYIKKAFNAYKKNFFPIIMALIMFFIILFGLAIIGIAPLLLTVSELSLQAVLMSGTPLIFFALMIIIDAILVMVLQAGLIRMYADCLKGKGKVSTMFKTAKEKFWTIIGANLIQLFILGVIMLLFSLPMILTGDTAMLILFFVGIIAVVLVNPLLLFIGQAIVITNLKAVASVNKSINVGKKNYFKALGLLILFGLISMILGFIPIVGIILNLFLIAPLSLMTYTALYLKVR